MGQVSKSWVSNLFSLGKAQQDQSQSEEKGAWGGRLSALTVSVGMITAFFSFGHGAQASDGASCETLLTQSNVEALPSANMDLIQAVLEEGQLNYDKMAAIMSDSPPLTAYLSSNPQENLAVRAPLTVMNAGQRMLAMIYTAGVEEVEIPYLPEGKVRLYPFFSSGTALTNGKRVVGQYYAGAALVDNIYSQAQGDRSGASPLMFVGPHGTGKTEFLKLLGIASENLTGQIEGDFAIYSYSFVDLYQIPALRGIVVREEVNGEMVEMPWDAPKNSSPVTLFPEQIQDRILEVATPKINDMIRMDPAPVRVPDSQSQVIRNEIILHYTKEKGRQLTLPEVIEVLNKHVRLRRVIMGEAHGTMPMIDPQGNDVDVAGLFMAPNPVMRATSNKGPADVMSWYLNGKVLKGDGNATFLDEFLRNPQEVRDLFLRAFESRMVSIGGAPSEPLDTVFIAATNSANLEDAMSSPASHAQVDRFKMVPMRWTTVPREIAQTLLYMKGGGLKMQSLEEHSEQVGAEWQVADLDQVYPFPRRGQRALGPDYRYRLAWGTSFDQVYISPHVLSLMAEIIAATRMETDPKAGAKVASSGVLALPSFQDPITRLRIYQGESSVKATEWKELKKVTTLLREGDRGISSRDAGRWLTAALSAARAGGHDNTLTPELAYSVFQKLLGHHEGIQVSSHQERVRWKRLAERVATERILPRLKNDVSQALASNETSIEDAYREVLREIREIYQDPEGQRENIDMDRYQKIQEYFVKRTGRPLDEAQISLFYLSQSLESEDGRAHQPHELLMEAVTSYYADLSQRLAQLGTLAHSDQVIKNLVKMGYNDHSAQQLHLFIKYLDAQVKKIEEEQKGQRGS